MIRSAPRGVPLTYAGADYDRTLPLRDGSVVPTGLAFTYLTLPINELFLRQVVGREFDASEISLSNLITLVSRGVSDFVAIPVFPSRTFRHSAILVRHDAPIRRPADLIGRRVGVRDYTMTAALYVRGLLQHEYDVAPTSMDWYWGGLDRSSTDPLRVEFAPPPGLRLEWIGPDRSLMSMIEAGELDALVVADPPRAWIEGTARLRRLFPDYKTQSIGYYRRTSICPIMHVVAIKREIVERHPWISASLYEAFGEAKRRCFQSLRDTGALRASLLFLEADLEEERRLFGGDPWPDGIRSNKRSLEAAIEFSWEQGLSDSRIALESLFDPQLLRT